MGYDFCYFILKCPVNLKLNNASKYNQYLIALLAQAYVSLRSDNLLRCQTVMTHMENNVCFISFENMELLQLIHAMRLITFDFIKSHMMKIQQVESESVEMSNNKSKDKSHNKNDKKEISP